MSNKLKILSLLNYCTDKQIYFLKRMYSNNDLTRSIPEVLEIMTNCQLKTLLSQVRKTVELNMNKRELKLKKIKERYKDKK